MKKNRTAQVFSLAFLDCICCGFGAIILIFVLTLGKSPERGASVISQIQEEISRIAADLSREQLATAELEKALRARSEQRFEDEKKREASKQSVRELEYELSQMLDKRSSLKAELDKLLGAKQAIPTRDESAPLPIPNVQRRQYLTGFNFEGNYVLFLVEASGGMLGYTVDEALQKVTTLTDEQKRQTEKWRRVVRSVQWIMANLGPRQAYQVIVFNREAQPLIPERAEEWLNPLDRVTTREVLQRLAEVTPVGGANLERAFLVARESFPSVDSTVLITDSLPTLSDTYAAATVADDDDRERFFRAAIKQAPRQTPVNVLLFPMSGDPAAAFLYWQFADATRGSMISPSPTWPDI